MNPKRTPAISGHLLLFLLRLLGQPELAQASLNKEGALS